MNSDLTLKCCVCNKTLKSPIYSTIVGNRVIFVCDCNSYFTIALEDSKHKVVNCSLEKKINKTKVCLIVSHREDQKIHCDSSSLFETGNKILKSLPGYKQVLLYEDLTDFFSRVEKLTIFA